MLYQVYEDCLDFLSRLSLMDRMAPKDPSIQKAIEAAGTSKELARRLGITPQALSQWKRVPPLRALLVERVTGIPRHELRPDIYPAPSQKECA